jgi:hypothetical protein
VEKTEHAVFHEKLVFPFERFVLPWSGVEARAAACGKFFFGGHGEISAVEL